MSKCEFCGQEAGFLRKKHKECQEKHDTGKKEIMDILKNTLLTNSDLKPVDEELLHIAKTSFIPNTEFKSLLISTWENGVNLAFEDKMLTKEEENSLASFTDHFSLDQGDLDKNGAYTKVVKGGILRELFEGNLPQRATIEGNIPFNFQKDEVVIWIFQGAKYLEHRTRIHYQGGYSGVSVRIVKGVYYRTGGFRGNPVSTEETIYIDTGLLAVTDKHMYFCGNVKSFRIAYDKIVSFTPYSNGVGIQRDAQTAKPQTFVTEDGWFTYNLITNLAKRNAS